MIYYSVSYKTESGDEGYVGLFDKKPTDEHLYAWTLQTMPDELIVEFYDGEDYTTNLVYFYIKECFISKLPDPLPLPSNYGHC